MTIIKTVEEWKEIQKKIDSSKKIGFVPTMGGLHEGHMSLVEKCKSENEICVVSIYLNPTQFDNKNDLLTYPASFEDDIKLLEENNVDYLFAPNYKVMYPDDYKYKILETDFSKELCGAKRPGHFEGVLTIVMKLFNIIKPQNAYFGEKDFQQYKLLDGMVKSFFLDVNLIPCPIIREKSGLAISSRNRKLSETGKEKAALLHQVISEKTNLQEKQEKLEKEGFVVDYITEKDNRIFVAAFLEDVRLIDNVLAE